MLAPVGAGRRVGRVLLPVLLRSSRLPPSADAAARWRAFSSSDGKDGKGGKESGLMSNFLRS
jgi:hypothetical protein